MDFVCFVDRYPFWSFLSLLDDGVPVLSCHPKPRLGWGAIHTLFFFRVASPVNRKASRCVARSFVPVLMRLLLLASSFGFSFLVYKSVFVSECVLNVPHHNDDVLIITRVVVFVLPRSGGVYYL